MQQRFAEMAQQPKQPDWPRLADVVLQRPSASSREAGTRRSGTGVPFLSLVPSVQGEYAKTLLVFVRNFA